MAGVTQVVCIYIENFAKELGFPETLVIPDFVEDFGIIGTNMDNIFRNVPVDDVTREPEPEDTVKKIVLSRKLNLSKRTINGITYFFERLKTLVVTSEQAKELGWTNFELEIRQ